jgi:hypothetical protein
LITGIVPEEQRMLMAPPPPPSTCPLAVVNSESWVPKLRLPKFSPEVPPAPLTWQAAVSVRVELMVPVTVAAWAWEVSARPRPTRMQRVCAWA